MESLGLEYDPKDHPNEFLPKDPALKKFFRHRSNDYQWQNPSDDEIADEFFDEYIDHTMEIKNRPQKPGTKPRP